MEATASLCVTGNLIASFDLSGQFKVILDVVLKIVGINKVITGVVWRVNVNEGRSDLFPVGDVLRGIQH